MALVLYASAYGQATDAISREVSVFNDLTPPFPLNAVSREVAVLNDLAVVEAVDSISREVAVLVFQQRVSSNLPAMALPVEAVMPGAVLPDQLSLLTSFGSTGQTFADGDIDLDGDVDLTDLSLLLSTFGQSCP